MVSYREVAGARMRRTFKSQVDFTQETKQQNVTSVLFVAHTKMPSRAATCLGTRASAVNREPVPG